MRLQTSQFCLWYENGGSMRFSYHKISDITNWGIPWYKSGWPRPNNFGRRIWREITCGIMSGMIYNLCLLLYQPIFFGDWRFISEEFHDLKKWSWTYTWDWSHVGNKGYRFLKTQTVSFLCDPKSKPFLPGSRFEKSLNLEWRVTKSWCPLGLFWSIPRSARFLRGLEYKLWTLLVPSKKKKLWDMFIHPFLSWRTNFSIHWRIPFIVADDHHFHNCWFDLESTFR